MKALSADELKEITARTVNHYHQGADTFWERTRDHDVSQNIQALLEALEGEAPCRILDFGCGPGRDLQRLTELGHEAVGLDGCSAFVERARMQSGCEVLHQNFIQLQLPEGHFDGVFANASLFHVPNQQLPEVLSKLHRCLKSRGVLFASNPRGGDQEGWHGERYGTHHSDERWLRIVADAGFELVHHYYRPAGLPRDQQPWLASVWRQLPSGAR